MFKPISALKLKNKIENDDSYILIDIRERYQFEDYNIGGINIPMAEVLNEIENIKYKNIVFCCDNNTKSKALATILAKKYKNLNIFSLENGILGYFEEIES